MDRLVVRAEEAPGLPALLSRGRGPLALAVLLGLGLQAAGCAKAGPDPVEEGRRIQTDIRRAIITTKSLGRFGTFALFQEEMEKVPCEKALSPENRDCEVQVVGKGLVRMRVSDAALEASGRVIKDALVRVEYEADCTNQSFDFKTFDNVLPRSREPAPAGMAVWADRLVRVTHWRLGEKDAERCGVLVEAAPQLLEEILKAPGL